MTDDLDAIAERVRADLGATYVTAIADEDAMRPAGVSPPDMHVAMLEGIARFAADVVLAGHDAGGINARMFLAEWIIERVRDQMASAQRSGAPMH